MPALQGTVSLTYADTHDCEYAELRNVQCN